MSKRHDIYTLRYLYSEVVGICWESMLFLMRCLGHVDSLDLITKDGVRFADVGGKMVEVVVPSAGDIANSQFTDLAPDSAYVVGSGKSGVAETLGIMGASYLTNMLLCA